MGEPVYHVRLLSKTGGSMRSSIGAGVATEPFDNTNFDTLDCLRELRDRMVDTGLIKFLRQALERSRPVTSTVRRRHRAGRSRSAPWPSPTTHWYRASDLQVRTQKRRMEEDRILIIDGPVWTLAGMIDLALAMIEQERGRGCGPGAARQQVVYHRRAGGHSQFSALLDPEPKSDRIRIGGPTS
jgi:transcriptional regulator GlxA family with amidase domain